MNLADIIILIIVAAMVGLAVRRLYKNHKEDKGCGCGCSGCSGKCGMSSTEKKKRSADKAD